MLNKVEGINLSDVLSEETTHRPEKFDSILEVEEKKVEIKQEDFTEVAPTSVAVPNSNEPIIEEEEKATPEESAQATIGMIDLLQKTIFSFVAAKKLKNKFPQALLDRFVALDIKDMSGELLDDEEKRVLARYKDFERRLKMISDEIPLTETEKADLMPATIAICKKHGIAVPTGLWFGCTLLDVISKRAINIFTS
jgi:hypothetical protein